MPYKLRKAPNRDLYWVVNKDTGKKYSNDPLPREKAEAQMKALYASENGYTMRGSGTHRENFLHTYNVADKHYTLHQLSKITSVPKHILQEVYNRGIGAYKTQPTSVRLKHSYVKNVDAPMGKKLSKEQWAYARVYSFLDGNPNHDEDLRRNLQGAGFWDSIASIGKKVWSGATSAYNAIKPVAQNIQSNADLYANVGQAITGLATPSKLNPSSLKWLNENKDFDVVGLTARRAPVNRFIEGFFTLLTQGKWDKAKKDIGYDKMFHLALQLTIRKPDGTTKESKIEKLSQLNFTDDVKPERGLEVMPVPMRGSIKVGDLIGKTEKLMGADFYKYDAFQNNCQMFVMNVLDANGLMTPEVKAFVYQPVDELLKQQPSWIHNFSRTVTNLGSITDRIFQGYGEPRKRKLLGCKATRNNAKTMLNNGKRFVKISMPEFESEHKRLLNVLSKGNKSDLKREYEAQKAELSHEGMKGNQSVGFGMRTPSEDTHYPSFGEQLKEWGVPKEHYLREVSKLARKFGYLPQSFQLATDGKHKLEVRNEKGRIVRFGRVGYGDYILWKALEAQGKTPKGTASQKRKVFHQSHEKIRGNWKQNPYSPNNLALRLLW
ncbi:hypothetical protein EBZ38_10910 [bacterium]|nr:hypothetical protein [bacterium]NBW78239.1 hypothetical protein [Betaproteobacteria bacterium]NDC95615.1 hypothetical protein [bacterium]NDD84760.1 hypothetical protein [bacterium]